MNPLSLSQLLSLELEMLNILKLCVPKDKTIYTKVKHNILTSQLIDIIPNKSFENIC